MPASTGTSSGPRAPATTGTVRSAAGSRSTSVPSAHGDANAHTTASRSGTQIIAT
ncbi:Uncharacterised protein [Mycobacteroides abscessus]|nr:Uncharacterised protein [Mycobacteroides abscessus]